ncbi:MAG: hypothetical protein WBZ36_04230 [Candidatus Nitrosopolaris sp.]
MTRKANQFTLRCNPLRVTTTMTFPFHGYYKSSKYTKREGNIRSSESATTGNAAQGTSNTATIEVKCTTGYIWYPSGGFRHCALGTVVNAPEGSTSTHPGLKTGNAAQGTSNTGNAAQGTSNTGNAAQGTSNTGNAAQGTSNTATIEVKCTTGYIWYPSG